MLKWIYSQWKKFFPMCKAEAQIELAKIEVEKMRIELNDKENNAPQLPKP